MTDEYNKIGIRRHDLGVFTGKSIHYGGSEGRIHLVISLNGQEDL